MHLNLQNNNNCILPASRTQTVEEYYFSVKLQQINQMRQSGLDVINLGIGSPDMPPSTEVIQALAKSAENPTHHAYQTYRGTDALRQAYADWYLKYFAVSLNPSSEILPLIGSKEGIMHISMAFLDPGDQVLIPDPGYPTYSAVTNLVGAKAVFYDLTEENNWLPDLDSLEKTDLSGVKMMWVNYPHMPTGALAGRDFFERLITFGKKHNILICNDNPYAFILNDNPLSLLSIEGSKSIAIELNSLSKSHNMAGWRMGMVASNKEFINHIVKVKSNMDSGMFRPMQDAAVAALSLDADWYNTVNDTYSKRRKFVWQIFDALGCKYDSTQIGMFVWAKIPNHYQEAMQISDSLLEEANVFITPGHIFGKNGKRYLRVSLCTNEERLNEALDRIKKWIKNK